VKASYAGVDLLHATKELRDMVAQQLQPETLFQTLSERGRGTAAWTYVNYDLGSRGIKLDSVYWPMGAQRWAVGYFICSGADLEQIMLRAVVAGVVQKCQLLIGDGVNDDLSMYMSMLPPIPLLQAGSAEENVYLLTLVDDRYYWWFANNIDLVITSACDKTWAQVLDTVGSALGTMSRDTPATAYVKPCHALTSHWQFLPVLLDTAAYNVGMRVHVDTDQTHTIYVKNANSALTVNDTLFNQTYAKVLGTNLFDVSTDERALAVPKQVRVGYPKQAATDSRWPCTYELKTKTLTSLVDAQIVSRLTGLGVVGFNEGKIFHDTCLWQSGSPNNDTEIDDLTTQIATDWYKWQLGRVHGTFVGLRQIAGHGLIDSIEWLDTGEEELNFDDGPYAEEAGFLAPVTRSGIYTIVRRPPVNDLAHELLHCGTYGCDPECEHPKAPCLVFEAGGSLVACMNPIGASNYCTVFGAGAELVACGSSAESVAHCVVFSADADICAPSRIVYHSIRTVTADRLLGRISTSGTIQEISLGYPLFFTGSALNVVGRGAYLFGTFTGTTTDSYVHITNGITTSPFTLSTGGVVKVGIKNTDGADSLDWKIICTDKWGSTETLTRTVAAGAKGIFVDDMSVMTTIGRPFASISIEVISTSAGNHATYTCYFCGDA
jgi:hypothetical protein